MASSSSQTAESAASGPWDVFLSFYGKDTRNKFTSHLYAALDHHGIRTFMDDPNELRNVHVISDAIKESKIYVIVFSENYASSHWCLDELVEILNCHQTFGRLVVPVFYNIDPSVVPGKIGSFNNALQKHETCFDSDKLVKWRVTLTTVGKLSGYEVSKNMSDFDLINQVVNRVLLEIQPMTLDVAKYPVGLDSRVKEITSLMSINTESVSRIGIYGMGGVGKTTLAKAVYNQNYHRFQGSCFLENVREVSGTKRGLVRLQQQLIDDVLKCKNIKIDNVDQGIELIRARICFMKVLIVIDDLDNLVPLEFLEGPFSLGSKIIITTRNEDLLDLIKVEARYKANELGDAESRQLFTKHAFGDKKISNTLMELSEEIIKHAGGLPLALKVFASRLLNQSEKKWRLFIQTLKRDPTDNIEKQLVTSFDVLKLVDPMLQNFFIDIACFFVGWKKEEVVKILETYYMFVNLYIDILRKRCLLTINNRDELGMHDLLRDMGRKIACNNSPREPGKHSRLWVSEDICNVLKNHKGTKMIKGIIPHNLSYQDALDGVSFATTTFKRMSNLRFLYLENANLTGSFQKTFKDLRWLCWKSCPLECLPSNFYPQHLVTLSLPHSKMRTIWEPNMVSKVFLKLKTLNMSHSLDLTTTPDFNKLPCLETLNLESCKSLEEVHMPIGSLGRLVSLNLRDCVNLSSLQDSICDLKAMKSLNIVGCSSLKALPVGLGDIKSLKELNAEGLTLSKLPESMERLSYLVQLRLIDNKNLKTLSKTICNLRALEVLDISGCSHLEALPCELGKIKSLKELNAEGLTVFKLPDSIGWLTNLVELRLSYNKNLQTLPDTICNLRVLKVLYIDNCSSLEALPIELGKIESLKDLNAEGLSISKLPDSIGRLSKLVKLRLSNNESLQILPDTFCNLRSLENLVLIDCLHLSRIVELPFNLKRLNADGCVSMERLPNLSNLKQLEILNLTDCSGLTEIQGLKELTSIKALSLCGCNLYLLTRTFTKVFFQVYSRFGHQIKIYTSSTEIPNWISQSCNLRSIVSLDLLPSVSHDYLAMILCFRVRANDELFRIDYSIKTTTCDFIWSEMVDIPYYHGSVMVIVPMSIFSLKSGDDRIEVTANVHIIGIHLLHETEITTMMDDYDRTTSSVEDERSYRPSKRLKQLW